MGTNYYIKEKECKHCDRYEEVHLGKSSAGWKFAFQYNGGELYKNKREMKKWLKGKQIWNEYGDKVSQKSFWEMIEVKQDLLTHSDLGYGNMIIEGYDFTYAEFS